MAQVKLRPLGIGVKTPHLGGYKNVGLSRVSLGPQSFRTSEHIAGGRLVEVNVMLKTKVKIFWAFLADDVQSQGLLITRLVTVWL